jgi:hypothetical protein
MLHLKCCSVCLSFADTLALSLLHSALARGAPASSLPPAPPTLLLAPYCSLAPRTDGAHPPLLAPSLPAPVAPPPSCLLAPSPSLPLALLSVLPPHLQALLFLQMPS